MSDEASRGSSPPPDAVVEASAPPRRRWYSNILIPLTALAVAGIIVVLFATQWVRWGRHAHPAVNDFDRVKAGDLLVEIDRSDYEARVAQAEADLLGAEAAMENLKTRKAMQRTGLK